MNCDSYIISTIIVREGVFSQPVGARGGQHYLHNVTEAHSFMTLIFTAMIAV